MRPHPKPQLTKPASSKKPSSWHTNGPPPSPWHASLPSSPVSREKEMNWFRIEIESSYFVVESRAVVLASGTETRCWQNEYFLRDCVHFSYAFGIADNRDLGFTYTQWNGSGFAHVSVSGDSATFASRMADAPRWQTNEAHTITQFSLSIQFQQRNIIVQRLAVVIVMNVCGGHAKCLCARTAEFTR